MASGGFLTSQLPSTTVVGIGTSAGGVKALGSLLEDLPAKTGAAFVVIMHPDPARRSELPSILGAHTKMAVVAVTGSSPLKPDHLFMIPPTASSRSPRKRSPP